MTANNMVGDDEKAIQAGINDYISKPINVKKYVSYHGKMDT